MKKIIKLTLLFLVSSSLLFLSFKITSKLNHKKEIAERTKVLPHFSFINLEGKVFTQHNLKNKPIIFVYFNSDCNYCQSEASKIEEKLQDFKNVQLLFVSFEEKEGIVKFAKQYKLDNQDNIVFLEDRKGEFSKLFDVNSIPYIVVYNKNGKFLKKFKGITKTDDILKVLK